ncbi:MAG: hypothetical protein ACR2PR_03795 [Pseudohongiellaceae bacterium]
MMTAKVEKTRPERSAFFRGFLDGIASPFTLFNPPDYDYYARNFEDDIVRRAWEDVGEALSMAMKAEEQRHGQTTQEEVAI